MKNLLGVVMCGGESRRMGRDKGLLETKNTPWAKSIANIFVNLEIEYVLSINAAQIEPYAQLFDDSKLIVDSDFQVRGPLRGLLSIYKKNPARDLLLIACDLQDMDTATVDKLTQFYLANKDQQYLAYKVQNFIEPLCAIYTSKALKDLYALTMQDALKSFSLQKIINDGTSKFISIGASDSFKNYNTLG